MAALPSLIFKLKSIISWETRVFVTSYVTDTSGPPRPLHTKEKESGKRKEKSEEREFLVSSQQHLTTIHPKSKVENTIQGQRGSSLRWSTTVNKSSQALRTSRQVGAGHKFICDSGEVLENCISYRSEPVVLKKHNSNTNIAIMPPRFSDKPMVYFDLETTDFINPEILQIGAKYEGMEFCCYVQPQRRNPVMATHIHGFTYRNGTLFQDGNAVDAISLKQALFDFLDFLKSINEPCVLVAHNVGFDAHQLLKALNICNMINEYRNWICGFADTCRILKNLVQDVHNHKLKTLAHRFRIHYSGLHDALVDVRILEGVFAMARGTVLDLAKATKSFDVYVERRKTLDKRAANIRSLDVLKDVLSKGMREKLADAGISMAHICKDFNVYGWAGLRDIFEGVFPGRNCELEVNNVGEFLEANVLY